MKGERDHLVFSAQPNGIHGKGGHTHNDKLSFTLTIDEDDFFIDPGTGVYTANPKIRNILRSTRSHNTVQINAYEQNNIVSNELFSLGNDANAVITHLEPNEFVEGTHKGYSGLSQGLIHQREIQRSINPLKYTIFDKITGSQMHTIIWNFILGPEIQVTPVSRSEWHLKGSKHTIRLITSMNEVQYVIEDQFFSPAYGILQTTKALRISTSAKTAVDVQWKMEVI